MKIDYHVFSSFRPLPSTYLQFTFPYEFTGLDYEILTKCQAHTSLGFRWFWLTSDDIYIHRGTVFYYSIHLDRKNNQHSAVAYLYSKEESLELDDYLQNQNPIELLTALFTRWRKEGLYELIQQKKQDQPSD